MAFDFAAVTQIFFAFACYMVGGRIYLSRSGLGEASDSFDFTYCFTFADGDIDSSEAVGSTINKSTT